MDDFKSVFATNKKKEDEGVWFDGPNGMRFQVARAGNANAAKLAGHLYKPHRRLMQMGKADEKVLTDIAAEIVSRTILLGWSGMPDGNGGEVPYSHEEAKRRLLQYPDFADFIGGLSQQVSAFQDEEAEAGEKNSLSASSGT